MFKLKSSHFILTTRWLCFSGFLKRTNLVCFILVMHYMHWLTVQILTVSFMKESAKAKVETCNEWRDEIQFIPQLQLMVFYLINHSIILSHPILWWVLVEPKAREGRRAGLGVQGEREARRFGGRTLSEWGSAGTKAETASWQEIVFSLSLKDDTKLSNFDSPDLNEKVGVEDTVAGEAGALLSAEGDWGPPLRAPLCCWLCGCSSTAAVSTSISASSMSLTLDGCSHVENTRSMKPF